MITLKTNKIAQSVKIKKYENRNRNDINSYYFNLKDFWPIEAA